jgi:sulfatase maturation enzyme AslB (radical SAM superfamily)
LKTREVFRAWGKILSGRKPSLSIEVTRECPLRCPGCYAYDDAHLGGNGTSLRTLADYKGHELVSQILKIVDEEAPLHVSLVGGDPLVRYREMEQLVPELLKRDVHVQLVTSAFRAIPGPWSRLPKLNVVVSIDGLAPEHDARRKPATYDRVLKNIAGQHVTVHCTITSQIARAEYLQEFARFWNARAEVKRIWFSIFTPQRGAQDAEILSQSQRCETMDALLKLRRRYTKIDMQESVIRHFTAPISSADECIFAQTTKVLSADLKTRVSPCQFGGDPDCSQCGCIASMGLAALGNHRLAKVVPVSALFRASTKVGQMMSRPNSTVMQGPEPALLPILDQQTLCK